MQYQFFNEKHAVGAVVPTGGIINRSLARFTSGMADHVKPAALCLTMLMAILFAAPAQAAGPVVSFDASALALPNGTTITAWGGQTAVGTPTYLSAQTPNGSAAVEFNGSDRMGDNIALPAAGGDWILVAVIKPNSIGAYHNLADDDPGSRPMLWIDFAFNYEFNYSGGGGAKAAGTGTGGWDIVIADSSLNQLYVNSSTANAWGGGAVSYPSTKPFDFFHRDGGQTYQGQVAEMRIYNNRADFGGDFAALYNEMHAKWIAPANEPPVAVAGATQTIQCTGASSANATLNGSASSDPDAADLLTYAWSWAGGSASGVNPTASFPLGETTVTLTVDDQNGHTDSTTTTVTVQNTTVPSVNAGADVVIEATNATGEAFDVLTQATLTDSCCGVSSTVSPAGPYTLGATTVTVSGTDCSNNTSSDQMVVTVQDTTAPVLTVPGNVNIEANGVLSTVSIGTATATDIFGATVSNDAPATFPLGTTTITYTATDGNGLTATGAQTVTVVDTTAPTVTATLVPVELEDDEGKFRVEFTVTDIADPNSVVTAMLNGTTVSSGQIVELERDHEAEVENEHGQLEIKGMFFNLNVSATDVSGNTGNASATFAFQPKHDDHDDDDD